MKAEITITLLVEVRYEGAGEGLAGCFGTTNMQKMFEEYLRSEEQILEMDTSSRIVEWD